MSAADLAAHAERAREVHGQHEIPVLVGMLGRRRAANRAGIVDQDVDRPSAASASRTTAAALRVAHVAAHRRRAPTERLDGRRRRARRFASIVHDDVGACSASAIAIAPPRPAVAP